MSTIEKTLQNNTQSELTEKVIGLEEDLYV